MSTISQHLSSQVGLELDQSSLVFLFSLIARIPPPHLFLMLTPKVWVMAIYTTTVAKEFLGLSATTYTYMTVCTQTATGGSN